MSITTRSLFYYGIEVTSQNNAIDLSEGGAQLDATLNVGSYTLTDFVAEISRALNDAGALTYTVSVNRTTRIITIAGSGTFSLLFATGTRSGTSACTLMGYTATNKTGTNTYTASTGTGSSYATQFVPQSYVSSEDSRRAANAAVNKSASGRVEVISFGEERFVEMNLTYITNINASEKIRANATGVEDARALMRFLITKAPFEFMANESTPNTYEKLILESTPEDQNGIAYRLKELYTKNLPGFYETGVLKFRVDLS